MELVLVRHGLPVRREDTDDPPLSAEGEGQAQRVARWLARERIDAVYSSLMLRAAQTAQPFAIATGLEAQVQAGIHEFDRGTGRYVPLEELKREDYPAWKALVDGGFDVDIFAFAAMVVAALEEIVAKNAGRRVAVFCHGGVVNVWT